MHTCTRIFSIDAAHRVLEHGSKCKHLHGHTYKVEVTCHAPELDKLGMVIDFGDVKAIVGKWLDDNWDHNTILNIDDCLIDYVDWDKANHGKMPYIMDRNPTAENLAELLFGVVNGLLTPKGIRCFHIRIYETPNCYADYEEK